MAGARRPSLPDYTFGGIIVQYSTVIQYLYIDRYVFVTVFLCRHMYNELLLPYTNVHYSHIYIYYIKLYMLIY